MSDRYEYKVADWTTNPPTTAELQVIVDGYAGDGYRLVHTVSSGDGYVLFFEKSILSGSFGASGATPGALRTGLNPPPE